MRGLLLVTLLGITHASFAEDDNSVALSLDGETAAAIDPTHDLGVAAEIALADSIQRDTSTLGERLSLDVRYNKRLAAAWRIVLADRVDMRWSNTFSSEASLNTLKEAYLSWQIEPTQLVDVGRINARYGVALGYNPTDFFRTDAVRSVVSLNPTSIRENRLGSAMLRGQTLWSSGSLTAIYSPRITDQASNNAFSPDLGASNHQDRWLVTLTQQFNQHLSPQWLLYGNAGGTPQIGVNITTLLNDATVAYAEYAGGHSASLLSQTLGSNSDSRFRSRLATGLTYTNAHKISITLEYEYNGAALDTAHWNNLYQESPVDYGRYRKWVGQQQDIPTRQNSFVYVSRQDLFIRHLDLAALMRIDLVDHSRAPWIELRYHWVSADLALQWQANSGAAGSDFGASTQRQAWQALLTYFIN